MTSFLSRLGRWQSLFGLIGVFILAVVFSPRAHDGTLIFLVPGNLTDILRQQAEIGIMALAMTLVIISGGIDLSVGSLLAFSASLVAILLVQWQPGLSTGMQMTVAIGATIAACTFWGILNGAIIDRLRIQPFIMTLAMMIGVRGLARRMTQNTNIDFGFGDDLPARFAAIFSDKILVIGIWAGMAIAFYLLLERTIFGRSVRAIGENEKASIYTGLPISRVKIIVYALSGLAAGLAGVIHAARSHQGNPNDGVAYELDAIAAVVIGGTSLAGGKGSILGTIVGTLIMGILTNLLRLCLIDSNLELIIKAVIIVVAVWIQMDRKSRA